MLLELADMNVDYVPRGLDTFNPWPYVKCLSQCSLDVNFNHDIPATFKLIEGTGPVCLVGQHMVGKCIIFLAFRGVEKQETSLGSLR